jgi:hypothetical protein
MKKQQKKTERLIAKKEQFALARPDQALLNNGAAGPEIQDLDD